ncbi:acyl-CoA dehydrogenase [Trujillonella humicola]|uniref:acyl-CoA dehydrogenase n=1 Tax=Trujillonella humicola TaxID=3383699 RepID=UPI00390665AB
MIVQVGVADTEDQRGLVDAVTRLLQRQWPADGVHKGIAEPGAVSERPLWSALADLGVAGLPLPEDQGGSGGRWVDLAVALEAAGGALAPVPTVAVAGALGALSRLSGDAAAQLRAAVAEGGTVATVTWVSGAAPWGAPGQVTATDAGDEVTLTGEVSVVLSPEADALLVPVGDGAGALLALVETGAAGVTLDRIANLDATRPLGSLRLEGARATVLARGDEAAAAVRHSLVTAATAQAAELTGVAGRCLTGAVAYSLDRTQFGRPIGSFQAIKHRCASMLTEVEQARAASRRLAQLLDEDADPDQLDDAAALALLQTGKAAHTGADEYLQILGGIGYTWEHEVHLYLRRATAALPLFGGRARARARLDPSNRPAGSRPVLQAPTSGPAAELAAHVRELLPRHRETWGDDDSFEARMAWQRLLHTVGWVAPEWPVEYGGRGLGIVEQVECDRVLAIHRAPLPLGGVLGLHNVAPTLMHWGTDEQKAHLPAIQAGTEVWCQGFSEPGSGSDLASLRTRAVIEGEGDDRQFVINGQKIWTSEGMEASHCLLLVRTDPDAAPHRGISALIVPLDTPGITRRSIQQIHGGSNFAEVFYDDVRVPYSALLGPLHGGWSVTMTTLSFERVGVIEMAAGMEQDVEDLVAELAGRELDAETRIALTDRLVEARLTGLLGERALGLIADGGSPGAEHSVIKYLFGIGTQRQSELRLTALGLEGVAGPTGVRAQHGYLHSRANTIAGGTTEIMKNILAERVLGMPR